MDINGLSFRKIVFTIFSISFGLSLHAQNSLKNNAELYSAADYFAKKILHTQSVRVDLYDTYYTVDEKPYAYIFECTNQNSPDSSTAVGISSSGSDYPLLFFAYGKAADVEKFLSPYINEKKYLTQDGFYVKRGGSFIKIPECFYDKTVSGSAVRELEIKVPLFKKNLSVAGSILNAWQNARQKTLSPRQSVKSKEDTLEVKLTDVPLYLWYLNCGITMWTMYCAYWNDKGYSDLIPGGDSRTGHYWAVADELCYLDESPDTQIFGIYQRVGYYVSDPEYGYDYNTYYKEDNAFTHDVWNSYQETIERTHHPLSVGWSGPPYGAHATLGVGFQIIDSMKFFILHDTWRDVPYYVNYNQYKSSLNGWCHWYFDSLNSFPQKIDYSKFPLGSKTISLSKINARFSPGLNTNNNSYHSFFIDDINADSTTEFLTGRFNNYSFPSLLLYTLSDSAIRFCKYCIRPGPISADALKQINRRKEASYCSIRLTIIIKILNFNVLN
ncbi:MAG TPA: hypothetical protein VHP38_07575, partial [Ruminiclostridium sp.]|nr:hypothetical protein [Ruminiclostridium sp.]